MELRHLRYFIAVAEELHFGRAAARLHISQPPLSQQIRQLEEELGLKLFSRRRRQIELTQAGRVFLPEAKQILSQMGRAGEAARRADRGQVGPLVAACGPIAVHTVLPLVLKIFRERFPEVELSLRESTEDAILEALQERSADVGLLIPYFESAVLRRETVLTVPMMAALPKAHPLAGRRSIRLKQLANERFVLFSRFLASGFYEHIAGLCQRAGFTPKVAQEAAQHSTLLALVAAGYGVALIPVLRKPAAIEDVAFVRIQEPWAMIQLCMAWRAGDGSPLVASFLAVVKACCRKAGGKKRRPRIARKR